MSDSIRIRTTPNGNDNYIKINLEQDFDFIEILSLKITQEEAYTQFCSDYGVIVGRVTVNNGFGVPNAKVSVFIPLDDIDKNNPEIKNLYPYELITDKNSDGIRYNLLPKEGTPDNVCFTPIGTFPTKREVLDNPTMLDIYCKYYKFTTTTNHAGDFMIFGVPLGTYTVHVDADVSDIGILSQRPYDLISQGTSDKMFDSPTKFKGGNNLDKLVQIKTANIGVNVQPFWGDPDNCQIGITRLDIPLNHTVTPSAVFMGSIFGDQDKNSVNKHCRPRQDLGLLCEQVTGEGTIEMIRKTVDGDIERFDVNGGRVIDTNGSWAYQIPMNLDYMITDEYGDLILTNDPSIGIPTRASVRFRIGMDETGGEGRLRTRAKYLVPNNPQHTKDIDYSFGPATNNTNATKDVSFKDLYWNKIYTVTNFIPRFQKNDFIALNFGNYTGIKTVDGCVGDKTPFPYSKVYTEPNPIFNVIMIITLMINVIVTVLNAITVPIINLMLSTLSIFGINKRLPCFSIDCSDTTYAPGCEYKILGVVTAGYAELKSNTKNDINTSPKDVLQCVAASLAESLNMFQFEFYNDWINGSLYSFLLKYKKTNIKGKHPSQKFCEYDCKDFSNDPNYTGTNSNDCGNNYLVDSCYTHGSSIFDDLNAQNNGFPSGGFGEGLIKLFDGTLYYAATGGGGGYGIHTNALNLFSTDIICLGSMLECDWQGIPKINDLLVPTTYKIPPLEAETDDGVFETSGMFSGNGHDGLFFDILPEGVSANRKGVLNIRHICEYGVNLDEITYDSNGNEIPPDGIIGPPDIDSDNGKWFRDVFMLLNSNKTTQTSFKYPSNGISSDFNLYNKGLYEFSKSSDNGVDYIKFRGYLEGIDEGELYGQPQHSYYFYFGLIPGKTALDVLNSSFFTNCFVQQKNSLIIQSTTTQASYNTNDGTITFSVIGGTSPITYTIVGPNYSKNGTTQSNTNVTLSNLSFGDYTIQIIDSLGVTISKTITIYGPQPLSAYAYVSKEATTIISNDGQIKINNINGGTAPYTYNLIDANGAIIKNGSASITTLIGIPYQSPIGYTLEIIDSNNEKVDITNLIVSGASILTASIDKQDTTCYGGNDGAITITPQGGVGPYTYNTIGPNSFDSTDVILSQLINGSYITTVTDSLGEVVTVTTLINSKYTPIIGSIVTTVNTSNINGSYKHDISSTGGQGNVTAQPYSIGVVYDNTQQITTTFTDSVGCTVTKIG